MASKKPATKARKAASPARTVTAARKPAAHRTEPRKAPAAARRPGAARTAPRPARRTAAARPVARAAAGPPPPPPPPRGVARPVTAPRASRSASPARPTGPASTVVAPKAPTPASAAAPRTAQRSADRDGGEALEPNNLLAGPRNVKPYVAKRGEQYMGKQQLRHFQEILAHWKRDLMMEVDRTVTHMKDEAANFPDPNDRATQEEEFSLELRTRDRERKLIRKIDEALKRADDGTYGYCLETGEEIGIKRLEARPVATLSLEAQERRERRERQYGDRDDRYR